MVMTQSLRDRTDDARLLNFFGVKVGELYDVECKCAREKRMTEQDREYEKEQLRKRIRRLREKGVTDSLARSMTFSADLSYNPDVSAKAQRYVDNFDTMLAENVGILFTGAVGTGKTFYAACIVNALIDKGIFAMLTSFSRIIRTPFNEYEDVLKTIEEADLVVFDDVGSERDTSFASERAFDAVDARIRARKPLIATTNLTPEELGKVEDIRAQRIYDRILGACIAIPVIGSSARVTEQHKKVEAARKLLI